MTGTYEGYTNYATWAICNQIFNVETNYTKWTRLALNKPIAELAGNLEAYHWAQVGIMADDFRKDLVTSALKSVDWVEVAQEVINTAAECLPA